MKRLMAVAALALPAAAAESPQRWAAELKVGPYLPAVDTEPGLRVVAGKNRPFAEIFKHEHRALYRMELDRQFLQGFGSLGLGLAAGFWQAHGKGRFIEGGIAPDATNFNIVPTALVLVYRFDWLADKVEWVPIVPYAKAGLAYSLWWITNGVGDVSTNAHKRGKGGTWGYELTAGVMLRLDPFDPRLAKEMDNSTGINDTSLFVELTRARMDDFGGRSLILSDDRWEAGLAVEF